jgi:hypothetical protein
MTEQSDKPAILSPRTTQILTFLQGFLPLMIAVCGGVWGLYTYFNQQNEARTLAANQTKKELQVSYAQARKPFLDRQFSLYQNIVETTATLVGLEPLSKDWIENYNKLRLLAMAQIGFFGDAETAFNELLEVLFEMKEHHKGDSPDSLVRVKLVQKRSLSLSQALRKSMERTWQGP